MESISSIPFRRIFIYGKRYYVRDYVRMKVIFYMRVNILITRVLVSHMNSTLPWVLHNNEYAWMALFRVMFRFWRSRNQICSSTSGRGRVQGGDFIRRNDISSLRKDKALTELCMITFGLFSFFMPQNNYVTVGANGLQQCSTPQLAYGGLNNWVMT